MKKIYNLLLLMVALICLPLSVSAETLTVANGTSLKQKLPIDGYNCDGAQHNQFIFLSDELSTLNGTQITALTFYMDKNYTWSSGGAPVATFKLVEVEATSVSSLVSTDGATQVYSGQIVFANNEWNITFSAPYSYNGGNLVIDIQTTAAGYINNNSNKGSYFYSANVAYGRGNYKGTSAQEYIPKTTFTYEEVLAPGSCAKPKNLSLSTSTPDAATFTWEQNVDETIYQWACVEKDVEVTSWNTLEAGVRTKTIEGLTSGTPYDFWVRSYCGDGENEQSEGVKKNFTLTCPTPTFGASPVSDKTHNSATVTWNAAEGITKYQFVNVVQGATPNWEGVEAKEVTSIELSGLTELTNYDFYVRSWYSATAQSAAVKTSFQTNADCSAKTVDAEHPWTEDFTGQTTNAIPTCWTAAGYDGAVYVASSSSYLTFSYGKALYFTGGGNAYAYAILPDFETDVNTLQIAFSHVEESSTKSGKIQFGYYKDATFEALKICDYSTSSSSWKDEAAFAITGVPTGAKLAFAYKPNTSAYTAAVDNITISVYVAPACPAPTALTVGQIGTDSAVVTWTSDAAEFALQYKKNGDADWTDATGTIESPFVLKGLTPNKTVYQVRVKSICGGDESDWVISDEFETDCLDKTIGWSENFSGEGLPTCWEATSYGSGYGQWYVYNGEMRFNARVSPSISVDLITPAVSLTDAAQLTFKHEGTSVTAEVYVNTNEGEVLLQSIPKKNATETIDLTSYKNQTVSFTFRGYGYGSSSVYLYLDDVAVDYLPVAAPTELAAAATADGAVVTWESAEGASWNLQYRAVGAEDWTLIEGLTEKTKTLEGLTDGTTYEVQVQTIVSANRKSAWTASVTFTPQSCASVTHVGFATPTYNSVEVAWDVTAAGTWDLRYKASEGDWSLVENIAETTYTLTGLTTGTAYTVEVKPACGDETTWVAAATTFTPEYTAPVSAEAEEITDHSAKVTWLRPADAEKCEYDFVIPGEAASWKETTELFATADNLLAGTDYLLVVRSVYPTGVSEADTTEFATITIAPKNLEQVGESTTDGATFTWEANGVATKYQWSTDNATWSEVQTVLTATVTGLNAGTSYTFYVRSYYSETVQSAAISLPFTTECATVTIGWGEDFGTVSGTKPNCWNIANWNATSANNWYSYSDQAKTGQALRYNAKTYNSADAITPSITISDKAELKFYIRNAVGSNSAKVECKVLVNDGTETKELADITTRYASVTQLTYDLSEYVGKTVTIIFRGVGYDSSTTSYLWIDDVTVTFAPVVIPTALAAAATADGAVVTWESAEEGTWNLRHRAVGTENWTVVEGLTEKTTTLTGLEEGTTYEVQVQLVVSANRVSEWTEAVNFTPQTCADVETVTFGAKTYNSVVVYWTVTAAGTWDLHYKAGEGEWTLVENIDALTYTLTGLTTNAVYTVEVKPSCSDAWVAAATTFTPVYTAPVSAEAEDITDHSAKVQWLGPNDATGYEYDFVIPGETAAWKETTELFATADELLAGTDYLLVVRSVYPTGVSEADTTEFATITIAPQNLAQEGESTTSSATFTWEANGAATQWQWSIDNTSWSAPISVLTATVDELEASTTYTFYVRSYYSETVQSVAISLQFSTECAVVTTPFVEDFEEGMPVCWETTGTWETSIDYKHKGTHSARCDATTAGTLTTPSILVADADAVLVFSSRNSYGSSYVDAEVIIRSEGEEDVHIPFVNSNLETLLKQTIDLSAYYQKTITITFSVSTLSKAKVFIDDVNVISNTIATGIDSTDAAVKATKRLENGLLIIEYNGTKYNGQGQKL